MENKQTPLEKAQENARRKLFEVMQNREEILTAFIAKYGCEPDQVEQIMEKDSQDKLHWYVKKKSVLIELVN